jgi:hypothetical protein
MIRVIARKGGLVLQWPYEGVGDIGDGRLLPLGEGTFAVGEERIPRRVRFEGVTAGGMAVAVWMNGGRWYRSFDVGTPPA